MPGVDLVPDLVRIVLEHIYASQITPDWPSFARYALISRVWSWHAQALLYSHVRLSTSHQSQLFSSAVSPATLRAIRLGEAVRIIRITISSASWPANPSNTIPASELSKLLRLCPQLYELRLGIEEFEEFTREEFADLQNTPAILALRIQDSIKCGVAAQQLLYVWPSVRHLVLKTASIVSFGVTGTFQRLDNGCAKLMSLQ